MNHRCEVRPLFGDVDAMNVVYYGNYLRFFEKGRAELMRSTGKSYAELADEGMHLPVTEAGVRYKRPAFYDDELIIETTLAWLKKASLRFEYRILKGGEGAEAELVTGFTAHACVDKSGKVTPIPEWVGRALAKYL